MENEEEKAKQLYLNPKSGFLSLPKLWKKIKEANINISYNDLKKILEQQETYQLTKQVKKPKEFSNIIADHPLQCSQLDIMIYDRYQIHNYKYVIGLIDVYSRYVVARPLTNMRMSTILTNLKEMCEELSKIAGHKKMKYPENMNLDNQFNIPAFTNFFTKQRTKLWFSQVDQPHKNALIERFWRTLSLLLQKMRNGTKNFDWAKSLPDAIENYNDTWHRSIKASPIELMEGKKENPIERKVVESVLKKNDRVRIKTKKDIYSKGDIATFSKDIYQIIGKKGKMNKLKNLNTGEEVKRLYHDEELDQTYSTPEKPKLKIIRKEVKPKIDQRKPLPKQDKRE